MAKIGPYIRLLLLLKHSLIFYRIDRSTNKKYLCESNFEMHLYHHMNLFNICIFYGFFTSMKDVFNNAVFHYLF